MAKINIARHGGFCFGVKRAVETALEAVKKHDKVFMLGDIVHNEYVIRNINDAGIKVVNNLSEINDGVLLLRAHGSTPQIYEEVRKKGLEIIDATCPFVLEIHKIVKELEKKGYQVVIIGDKGHDEVRGISAQVRTAIVISSPEDISVLIRTKMKKVGVVTQSTQNIDNVKEIINELASKTDELKFVDTICGPTKAYQKEIRAMPLKNDCMIIVGSLKSANTCRLTEIAKSLNPRSYQVESPSDIKAKWFKDAKTVGVAAGASTPDWIIQQVVDRIKELT